MAAKSLRLDLHGAASATDIELYWLKASARVTCCGSMNLILIAPEGVWLMPRCRWC